MTLLNENFHRILHIQINLDSKLQLQQAILIFETNCPRKIFIVKNTKIEHHKQLKLTLLIFLTRFIQLGFFWSKTEKVDTKYFLHNSAYSVYSSAKFQLRVTIFIFCIKFAQKVISGQKVKKFTSSLNFAYSNESLGTKFLQ